MLPPDLEAMWQRYLEEEKHGVRPEALRLLALFLDALSTQAPSLQRAWVMQLMAIIVDEDNDLPVRFPLFRRLLLPILVEGVNTHQPGHARWLAAFESMLYHSLPTGLPPELESRAGLLQEAVRLDPSDQRSLEKLLLSKASYFDYTLHELPSGVLYHQNGATPEQCETLLEQLGRFEICVCRSGQTGRYQELINECRFHYQAYRQYLMAHREKTSFELYLQAYAPHTEKQA